MITLQPSLGLGISTITPFKSLVVVSQLSFLMKCAIAESYTHIGQAQIDKGEVRDRASEEHNRKDEDHTGTPVRERELEYQGDTWVLLIHNSVGIYYYI